MHYVKSVPYSENNLVRFQSECRKIRTRITANMDSFQAVMKFVRVK